MGRAMFDAQFRSEQVEALLSPSRLLAHMLAFETALGTAQSELGLIPVKAAQIIQEICADPTVGTNFDLSSARQAGNPAIPFVKQLTQLVHAKSAEAANWVHYGATSQDVIDTSIMLGLREVFALVDSDLQHLRESLATMARKYAHSPMAGRTLLQQAMPTSFGFKVATWLAGLDEIATRLQRVRTQDLALQLGGPVGTLTTAGDHAGALVSAVAAKLQLVAPLISWHTNRGRVAHAGAVLALLSGQLGKIAQDIILLMQTEVGEAAEAAQIGKGGSSAMPHKHNPVDTLAAVSAATVTPQLAAGLLSCMLQEHERAAGSWHAEWLLWPPLCHATHRALQAVIAVIDGLDVDTARMRSNLELTHGLLNASALSNAIAPVIGKDRAHIAVETFCKRVLKEGKGLQEIATRDLPALGVSLSAQQLSEVFSTSADVSAAAMQTMYYLQARESVSNEG